jgi:transposase
MIFTMWVVVPYYDSPMSKSFLPDTMNQSLLMPPSLHDWVPEDDLARFVADVMSQLDLSAIYATYEQMDSRGRSAYAPEMMVRLLLYGYATGVTSSRQIETRTYRDIAFRFLSGDQHPDHDTIADFRRRHLDALAGLFTQALQLCEKAGLVKLGHVAIDGTKIKANASKHKAQSYERMGETEARLKSEIEALLAEAEAVDAAEDAKYGEGKRIDELPEDLKRRDDRLRKIQQAKAELEQEAREKAEQKRVEAEAKLAARREEEARTGKPARGRDPEVPDPEQARPDPKAQRNFTDPESRIMPDGANKGSFMQGYNAQVAVDSTAQVIVAAEVTQDPNDKRQLVPMLAQTEENLGRKPEKASADTGYFSEANVTDPRVAEIDLYVATGREKHGKTPEPVTSPRPDEAEPKVTLDDAAPNQAPPMEATSTASNGAVPEGRIPTDSQPQGAAPTGSPPKEPAPKEAMQKKLRTETGRAIYKMRKAIVEPVFGQIKEQRGIRRFRLRGLENVRKEWRLICTTFNLRKLYTAGRAAQQAA